MISSAFRGAYFTTTILYAISGLLAIIFSNVVRGQLSVDQLTNVVFTIPDLNLALATGIVCVVSSIFGVVALFTNADKRRALHIFGWLILVVATLEIALGAMLWLNTLQMRAFLDTRWQTAFSTRQIANFQKKFQCCGFAQANGRPADSPNCPAADAENSTQFGCRGAVAKSATKMTEVFCSALFGAVIIDVFAFLACAIMVQYRKDEERFKRIDGRGGKI